MTKRVRIENADTSNYKVVVDVYERHEGQPDKLIETKILLNPTDLVEVGIWKERYLVVREMT